MSRVIKYLSRLETQPILLHGGSGSKHNIPEHLLSYYERDKEFVRNSTTNTMPEFDDEYWDKVKDDLGESLSRMFNTTIKADRIQIGTCDNEFPVGGIRMTGSGMQRVLPEDPDHLVEQQPDIMDIDKHQSIHKVDITFIHDKYQPFCMVNQQ